MTGLELRSDGAAVDLTGRDATTRVALVRPSSILRAHAQPFGPTPSIGLAYIAAVLEADGHDVQVIDGPGEGLDHREDFDSVVGKLRRVGLSPEEIANRVRPGTTVVGIANMFLHEWPQVRAIAEAVKAARPEIVVVVGGENASGYWPWMFRQTDAIDYCVKGEGETTILELVARIANGEPVHAFPGLVVRNDDGSGTEDGLPTRLRQLGTVPRPAWHLFPIQNYLRFTDYWGVNRGRALPVMATRGCPYRCTFCTSPQMWTTRYIVRDPDDVADEIATFVAEYGIENFNFCDLTAFTKRKWTLAFCDALDERNLNITYQLPTGTRSEALDAEVLRRLYETGCRNLTYAPETGSPRMVKVYDKRVDLESVVASVTAASKIGLITRASFIIGHPEETWRDLWATAKYMYRLSRAGCDDVGIYAFAAYPGSVDFQRLVDDGRVDPDSEAFIYAEMNRNARAGAGYSDRFTARQLAAIVWGLRLVFYPSSFLRRPLRIVHHIVSFRTGNETSYVDQFVRVKLGREARMEPPVVLPSHDGVASEPADVEWLAGA